MDILRKELTEFYTSQWLAAEKLPSGAIEDCCGLAEAFAMMSGGCAVVTDAAFDTCSVYSGPLGRLLGISDEDRMHFSIASSDEDAIYDRLHPEDLVEKRMLEYEFFQACRFYLTLRRRQDISPHAAYGCSDARGAISPWTIPHR